MAGEQVEGGGLASRTRPGRAKITAIRAIRYQHVLQKVGQSSFRQLLMRAALNTASRL